MTVFDSPSYENKVLLEDFNAKLGRESAESDSADGTTASNLGN